MKDFNVRLLADRSNWWIAVHTEFTGATWCKKFPNNRLSNFFQVLDGGRLLQSIGSTL